MSKLKSQAAANTQTPQHAAMQWPQLDLPAPHPVFGMTQEHIQALHGWYASVQGAVNDRLGAMSTELESLKSQLNSSKK